MDVTGTTIADRLPIRISWVPEAFTTFLMPTVPGPTAFIDTPFPAGC